MIAHGEIIICNDVAHEGQAAIAYWDTRHSTVKQDAKRLIAPRLSRSVSVEKSLKNTQLSIDSMQVIQGEDVNKKTRHGCKRQAKINEKNLVLDHNIIMIRLRMNTKGTW